jgi:hypothetical protein
VVKPPAAALSRRSLWGAPLLLVVLTGCDGWSLSMIGHTSKLPDTRCLDAALSRKGWVRATDLEEDSPSWTLLGQRLPRSWTLEFSQASGGGGTLGFAEAEKGFLVSLGAGGSGKLAPPEAKVWKQRLQDLYASMRESCGGNWQEPKWNGCQHADCAP